MLPDTVTTVKPTVKPTVKLAPWIVIGGEPWLWGFADAIEGQRRQHWGYWTPNDPRVAEYLTGYEHGLRLTARRRPQSGLS